MNESDLPRAVAAAVASASGAGLRVDDATVIHTSTRIAVRLVPCDVLARVAYEVYEKDAGSEDERFELEVARRLAEAGSPVGVPDPRVDRRVYLRDGFTVTLWTYYESLPSALGPREYAQALLRLHAGMRDIEIAAPHFTDRVASAQRLLDDQSRTPELGDVDRERLGATLQRMTASITERHADEQLLHGEPHPGNLLNTRTGPLFIDLGTCCRGPVEFDIAHAPDEISAHYPGADQDLVRRCRILMLAMITTWRWDRDDEFPNGRQLAGEWMSQMRAALVGYGLDVGALWRD